MTLFLERAKGDTVFPVLEVVLDEPGSGRRFLLPSACFHDLFGVPDEELAGMGLAILGNTCKAMREAKKRRQAFIPVLQLRAGPTDEPTAAPWPGMPTDNPSLPLAVEELPFEAAMFLDDQHDFKKRIDRLALMRRIEAVWVPWLKAKCFALA